MLLNFMDFKSVSVKNSVSHESESLAEYHEPAAWSDISVDYHVAVAEDEILGVGMPREVVSCECEQLVVFVKTAGYFFAAASRV